MENKELFNNKTKEQPAQRQPMQLGLYDATNEHDACGVGMLVNIHGSKSHELVESALKVLENMRHRGAEGADNKTGDGAGIMLQIPHEFILLQGIPVPEKGKYGTGLLFLPKDEKDRAAILSIIIEEIEKEGLTLMHLRNVPTCPEILGEAALANEPDIKQIFITGFTDSETADRRLYIIRKRIENKVRRSDIAAREDFYIVSLSTKNIIYKGMLSSLQLRNYFPDLTNNYFTSGLALVHSRFSTNTFPTWGLAQPFRLLAHNGEINTIRGNRGWMEARESVLSSPALGDIKELRPIIQPNMSDSASLDNVLEFLVMSGLSLPHAMAMLVPESFNEKNPISEADVEIVRNLLREVKPHQIFVAGDLADPHGTHRVCTDAVFAAIDLEKEEGAKWLKDCRIWMYRGAWAEWEIENIEMAVPISPEELRAKRNSILKHQSQMESAPFLGNDERLFWQRSEDRNRGTAALYDSLGLASYEAMEAFVEYIPL